MLECGGPAPSPLRADLIFGQEAQVAQARRKGMVVPLAVLQDWAGQATCVGGVEWSVEWTDAASSCSSSNNPHIRRWPTSEERKEKKRKGKQRKRKERKRKEREERRGDEMRGDEIRRDERR